MTAEIETQIYNFRLTLSGANEIEASALCTQLTELDNLLKFATLGTGEYRLNVAGTNKGSFEILLTSIATAAITLTQPESFLVVQNGLKVIKEWFELKKHLKGDKPKKVEKTPNGAKVTNSGGKEMLATAEGARFFENAVIDNSIVKIFIGQESSSRNGMKISSLEGKKLIEINENDYEHLSKEINFDIEAKNKYINTININLLVKKADFIGSSMWEFFSDRTILAKIEDEDFNTSLDNHEVSITRGTTLSVTLRIENDIDKNGNPIEKNVKYYIEKVHKVNSPYDAEKEQSRFD